MMSVEEIAPADMNGPARVPLIVHIQQGERGPSYGRNAKHAKLLRIPGEVIAPSIRSWVKESHGFARLWIDRDTAIAASLVAVAACQHQVLCVVGAVLRLRDDMIHGEPDELPSLIGMAVFTPQSGALANESANRRRDRHR
jgi:hypothetical protein